MRLSQLLQMRLSRALLAKKPAKPDPMKDWEWHFSGMTWKDLKHHYAIIPIYLLTIGSVCMSGAYVIRLATKHPEVAWTRPYEPWEEYRARQYKFLNSGRDYTVGSLAPKYK